MTQDKTRKSIYPPIETVLNGEACHSRKFTRSVMLEKALHEKVIEFDDVKEGEEVAHELKVWDAYCSWMRIVFGVPTEKLEEVEFSEIEDAFMKVKTELFKRDGNRTEKHVTEIKAVTDKIEKSADVVTKVVQTAETIEKNVKGSGKKT